VPPAPAASDDPTPSRRPPRETPEEKRQRDEQWIVETLARAPEPSPLMISMIVKTLLGVTLPDESQYPSPSDRPGHSAGSSTEPRAGPATADPYPDEQ
jgi:hypothetical protein